MTWQRAIGLDKWTTQTVVKKKITSLEECAWLSSLLAAQLQLGLLRDENEIRWHNQAHWRDEHGCALKILTPSQGLYFPHWEMIVPVCHVNDGLSAVAVAINLTQRAAFQLLSSGKWFWLWSPLADNGEGSSPSSKLRNNARRHQGNCNFITTMMVCNLD